MMETLLAEWKATYDEMQDTTDLMRQEMAVIQAQIAAVEKPYRETLASLEATIRPMALTIASTVKSDGVEVRYRKGARRVTYKWQTVDSVLGVLRDVLPETAVTLEGARSESVGEPSVNILRI